MNLYRVDVWIKDNEWRTFLVVGEYSIYAMEKALEQVEEESIMDIIATEVTEIDGYKITIN